MIRLPRVFAVAAGALALVAVSVAPARAQYGKPMVSDPAVGEKYHVEAVIDLWTPNLDARISSESLGIIGSEIDVKTDLGYVNKSVRELRLVLRPGLKHKFRFAYTPISYEGDVVLVRKIIFNGIAFNVGLPIQTEFKWNTWRFGYEHDFIYTDRGFAGFIVEARYVDAQLALQSPLDSEFTEAKGPVPAIGGDRARPRRFDRAQARLSRSQGAPQADAGKSAGARRVRGGRAGPRRGDRLAPDGGRCEKPDRDARRSFSSRQI